MNKATKKFVSSRKKWTMRVDNKLKGAYGETDYEKKVIRINKKKHKTVKTDQSIPKKSRTLLDTIVHEEMHVKHPKMTEKMVRKQTPSLIKKMGAKKKKQYYSKLK